MVGFGGERICTGGKVWGVRGLVLGEDIVEKYICAARRRYVPWKGVGEISATRVDLEGYLCWELEFEEENYPFFSPMH